VRCYCGYGVTSAATCHVLVPWCRLVCFVSVAAVQLSRRHLCRSFWRLVYSAALPPNIIRERAIAHDFIFAFESTFLAPASSCHLSFWRNLLWCCCTRYRNFAQDMCICFSCLPLSTGRRLVRNQSNAMLASTRYALAGSCITTMSTDHSTNRRLSAAVATSAL
jgi:hypothetical protein